MLSDSLIVDVVDLDQPERYLIVVDATQESLYTLLRAQLEGDARTCVILDRRQRARAADGSAAPDGIERRVSTSHPLLSFGATVIRLTGGAPTKGTTAHEP